MKLYEIPPPDRGLLCHVSVSNIKVNTKITVFCYNFHLSARTCVLKDEWVNDGVTEWKEQWRLQNWKEIIYAEVIMRKDLGAIKRRTATEMDCYSSCQP